MVLGMNEIPYAYSAQPSRNPFRVLLALWRSFRDLTNTEEVAIVEIAFARSRPARRFARWDQVIARLDADERTAPMVRETRRFGPIDLESLAELPEGTLGRVFADHCRSCGLDPNLVRVPGDETVDRLLDRMYGTHDVWHVATGWRNDESGEVGLGGFYLAQLEAPFFAFLFAIVLLNTVFMAPATLRPRIDAFVAGYRAGNDAEPLFAVDWDALWDTPLSEVRQRLGLANAVIVGEGIGDAA
jgi:ubiquinone biosynthesis protein Coq4